MNNAICLSFIIKLFKKDALGNAAIYAFITINGTRTKFSIKRTLHPSKWILKAGAAKGTTEEVRTLNAHLLVLFA